MQQSACAARRSAPNKRATGKRVAAPSSAPRRSPRSRARTVDERYRSIFNISMVLLVALTALGMLRVAVLARAAEMTLSASRLSASIQDQRTETDRLEMDRNSLSTPARIEGIALTAMRMGRPGSVRYITVSGRPAVARQGALAVQEVAEGSGGRSTAADTAGGMAVYEGVRTVVAALADMSVGEAQALLAGDVGLVGSR